VGAYQSDGKRRNGFDALGDATRRAIFEQLADGPKAVSELARDLPVSRPAVSQHLKVLKEAGLVIDEADGTRRLYRLDASGLGALRAYVDRFWTHALTAFKQAVENPGKEGPR
jgi:DNA-binding transcriptional ArsR family regulator